MLDHEILSCELAKRRSTEIKTVYWYGIEDCFACSESIERYVHYLMFDKYLSECEHGIVCERITGSGCSEEAIDTSCVDIEVSRTVPSGAIITIT